MTGFVEFLTATPSPSPDACETALPPPWWPRRSGRLDGDWDWRSDDGERPVSQSTGKSTPRSGLPRRRVFRRPRDGSTARLEDRLQFFLHSSSVQRTQLGKSSRTAPLPSDIPRSDLPDRFCDFFSDKIDRICDDLDSRSCEPPAVAIFDGPQLSQFEPVTDELIREKLHAWSYPYFPHQTVPSWLCFVDHVYC